MFIGEIQTQYTFAYIAYNDLKKQLESIKPGDKEHLDRCWYSIQSFLVAVANVTKTTILIHYRR
ncbi:MAG: hypothetical protein WAM14_19695 [Candidatus Nitrosopolaris sp.]